VAAHFGSVDALMAASEEDIQQIGGLGPYTAHSIVTYFSSDQNRKMIEKLRKAGVKMAEPRAARGPVEGPLTGKSFVITGTLPGMSREEAQALIEQAGGKVTDSVSRNTDFLLVGANPGGTKYRKAQELNTPMIELGKLREMIGEGDGNRG